MKTQILPMTVANPAKAAKPLVLPGLAGSQGHANPANPDGFSSPDAMSPGNEGGPIHGDEPMNENVQQEAPHWPGEMTRLMPGAEVMEQQVEEWFAAGLPMRWVPIIDAENFPGGLKDIHPFFGDFEASLIVSKPKDLMSIPNGMKGWLMPLMTSDTDVACGRWDEAIYFLKVQDRRDGSVVTYQTELTADLANPINATPPGAEGGKSEGDFK